jgi:hypothetical protein
VSREDFIAIGTRLFAIYVLFSIIKAVPAAMQLMSGNNGTALAGLYIAILAVGALFCGLLWFFPLSVARKLLPVMRESRSEETISAPVGLSLGLTLIGVWLFATALVDASYWLTLLIRSKQMTQLADVPVEWTHEQVGNMVSTAIQLFLSAWLILGSSGIRRLIYKFRYGQYASAP